MSESEGFDCDIKRFYFLIKTSLFLKRLKNGNESEYSLIMEKLKCGCFAYNQKCIDRHSEKTAKKLTDFDSILFFFVL